MLQTRPERSDSRSFAPIIRSPHTTQLLVGFALALTVLTLYQSSLRNGFLNYDDPAYVTSNLHVRQGLSWPNVAWASTATVEANWHPVTWISHMADVELFGMNPFGHHLTNLVLHLCNVILLFLLLHKATGCLPRSAVVAALFAFHPLNVESVAWVADRKSLLCTFFLLLAFWAYGSYVRRRGVASYLGVILFFGLGLMAKPMIVTFPFMLLLLDFWPLRRLSSGDSVSIAESQSRITFFGLLSEKSPLFAMSAASAWITVYAQHKEGAIGSTVLLPLNWRIENAIYSYLDYILKGIWPSHLAVFYPHPENSLALWMVMSSTAILIGATALVWHYRRERELLVGWLWYLGTMVPVIGIVQVGGQAMADRYVYIPFLGLFVMVVRLAANLAARIKLSRAITLALVFAVLFGYASVSYRQITYWRNSYTLFSHAVQVTSRNAIAEDNLGVALMEMGHPELADPHFRAAIQIAPRISTAHYNLATLLHSKNRLDQAKHEYETALSYGSDPTELAQAHNNLGALLMQLNQAAEAISQFDAAIRINPNKQNSFLGRGSVEYKQGNLGAALSDFSCAAQLAPSAAANFWIGRTLEDKGDFAGAAKAYEMTLRLAPDMKEAQARLDAVLLKLDCCGVH